MPPKTFVIENLKPGKLSYGEIEIMPLPTGGAERIPVIVAQGKTSGPCLWITTGIHGPEHTGLNVVHQLATRDIVRQLRGTLVIVPALNPAGLRTASRQPYYLREDPNRLFPEFQGKPKKNEQPDEPPSVLETTYQTLFEHIRRSADFLIDLHNAWSHSLPFVFRDRVWYHDAKQKSEAQKLLRRMDELIDVIGISAVNEFPMEKYVREKLHRSVSGAVLNVARIPAVTVELGGCMTPDPNIVAAAVTGLHNVMKWAGMLEGELEPITTVQVIRPSFPVRRHMGPRAPQACIVRPLVQSGDLLQQGDPVVEMHDIYGRPVAEGMLCSEHDGWVMGLAEGVVRYPNDPVTAMAIRDDQPLIGPYPELNA